LDQVFRSSFRERILIPGHLPDDDIVTLMQHCRVFAYPSRYEGFGLPPLEALACGAPVIASTGGSLREVLAGLSGVVQVDPLDQERWNRTLLQEIEKASPQSDIISQWSQGVKDRYDWRRTANETARVWEEAAE
jgi:glycosyltransferase involved in cell wall biosynthesis